MRFAMLAAVALTCIAAGLAGEQSETEPETALYSIVEDCDTRFIALNPQREPTRMRWGDYGEVIDAYYGVNAYSHGQEDDPGRGDGSGRYQCTELVHRYLRDLYGVPSRIGLGLGNGVDLASGVARHWGGRSWTGGVNGAAPITLRYYANGVARCRPMVGSIVSIAIPRRGGARGEGHVAIIRSMSEKEGALTGVMFEQHGGASYEPEHMVQPGTVRFERDAAGVWRGVYSNDRGGVFDVEGWTNIVAQ
jgi:hypothetical protein